MSAMRTVFLLLLLALVWTACPRHESGDAAARLEALAAPQLLDTLMEDLVQLRNSIQIQGRALMPDEIAFSEKVDSLEGAWRQWRNRIETLKVRVENGEAAPDTLPLDALESKRDALLQRARALSSAL